ncbi:MAG: hypothetical protein J6386_21705 [Candidatus Synoicihabitans palmerolidicus]|nr:hypothetical protein [Candidatus Synoicihabitans palmerolidicus]
MVEIPVCYDGEKGPDLEMILKLWQRIRSCQWKRWSRVMRRDVIGLRVSDLPRGIRI